MPGGIGVWSTDTVAGEHTPGEVAQSLEEVALARKVGQVLDTHYKDHYFLVEVFGGCVVIRHPLLPAYMGEVIKVASLSTDPGMLQVMRAGGDILARFNLPRGKFNRDKYHQVRQDKAHVRFGMQTVYDFSTGKIKRMLPPELVR